MPDKDVDYGCDEAEENLDEFDDAVTDDNVEIINPPNEYTQSQQTVHNAMICPKCGSSSLQPVVKTSTSGGFSSGDACCGYLLLGPLGLLCGAHNKNTSNQTWWICQNCGNQFRDQKEASLEIKIWCISIAVFMWWLTWVSTDVDLSIFNVLAPMLAVFFTIAFIVLIIKSRKPK
jgi:transposase-like protein